MKLNMQKLKTTSLRGSLAPARIAAILAALDEAYPKAECALDHRSPWELLVATILSARKIVSDFDGQVPQTLAEIITIPGAARKTANVVLGVAFNKAEGVVVDTHVLRITRRLCLAKAETPENIEQELMRILPQSRWIDFSHQIIQHGRAVCVARKPKCDRCNLEQLCKSHDKTWIS